MDASGAQTVQDAIRTGMEEIAGAYAPAQHEKVAAKLAAALHDEPDPFDGGCPADVCSDSCHGGRGGTMGDAAAAMVPWPLTQKELCALANMMDANTVKDADRNLLATAENVELVSLSEQVISGIIRHERSAGREADLAAARRPFTTEENRTASNKAAVNLLNDLCRQIDRGDLRDFREIGNRIELATLLIK